MQRPTQLCTAPNQPEGGRVLPACTLCWTLNLQRGPAVARDGPVKPSIICSLMQGFPILHPHMFPGVSFRCHPMMMLLWTLSIQDKVHACGWISSPSASGSKR